LLSDNEIIAKYRYFCFSGLTKYYYLAVVIIHGYTGITTDKEEIVKNKEDLEA